MFAEYRKEREGIDCIKTDKGFIFYKIEFPHCMIHDYYVKPEFRQEGHGKFLGDQVFQICEDAGVETVFCQTDSKAIGSKLSALTIVRFGFKPISKKGTVTTYELGVKEWAE